MEFFKNFRTIDLPLNLVVIIIYLGIAKLGLTFSIREAGVTIFWPAGGFALALLLLAGPKYILGIFGGALAAGFMIGASLTLATAIALGNTLETVCAYWLLTHFRPINSSLDTVEDFFKLLFYGATISTLISAVIGPLSIIVLNHVEPSLLPSITLRWWMGDAIGIAFVTPLILFWYQSRQQLEHKISLELIALFFLTTLMGQIVFFHWFSPSSLVDLSPAWLLPFVIWSGLRAGRRYTSLLVLIVFLQALWSASHGLGHYANDMQESGLVNFWMFGMLIAVGGMVLTIMTFERKLAEEKITKSELFAKATIDASSAAICVLDEQKKILAVNQAWRDFYDDNGSGSNTHDYFVGSHYQMTGGDPEQDSKLLTGVLQVVRRERDVFNLEYSCHSPTEQRWFNARVTRFKDDSGNVVITHENITARKQAELREKSRSHVLELITSDEPLAVILEAIVRGVEQENPTMLCSILLLDDEGKHLLSGAAPSLPDFYNEAIHGAEIGLGVGSCGTAAFINERVIVDDIQNHPYWASYKELSNKAKLAACWSEPIRCSQGKVLGTFAIYHHEVNQPTEDHIGFFEQIADLASIAIERIQTKLTLQSSEERWAFALEGAGDGVWDWNIQTDQTTYSKRWKEMLGYTEDEIIPVNQEWLDRIHPEDGETVSGTMQAYLEGSLPVYVVTYRLRCKDDSYKWILGRGMAVSHDSHNKPLRMVGTHTDITERKLSEIALMDKEERLRLSLISSKQSWFDLDLQTGAILVSPSYPEMLGYDPAEFRSHLQGWQDSLHQDDRNAVVAALDECQITGGPISMEYRCLTKEGRWLWVSSIGEISKWDLQHKALRMIGIHADITDRKLAEEKLKLAASVFSYAREGITITDATGTIIDVNDTFTAITGYSREDAIGQNHRILQSGQQLPGFYADMWQALLEKGYWYGELWNRRKSGEVYAEMKTISAVYDEHGITTHYVALSSDITLIKSHQDQLEHNAHYDLLTSMPNRVLLADRLSQAMLQCSRHTQSLAVVFLDLDGFKQVNDAHGHDMGDELLIVLSLRMKEALREGDTLSRIGGDEFVAVLAGLVNVEDCEPVIERLLMATSEPATVGDVVLNVSASIGVTFYPQDKVDADQLMRHADQAMYVAKESGKNRYHIFDTAQDDAVKVQREDLEAIRSALKLQQFALYYQPKVNMRTGTVIGVEALIRWRHPQRGLLEPIEFLPIIENNPMSIEIGEWVIDTALTQISEWQAMGLNLSVSISVNIAAVQLQQSDFTARLTKLLAAHPDVEPRCLELEVLETSALNDVHHVSTIMNDCIELGVNFALDDFGTGYSSLTYLRRLPANLIKIDQSFVRDMLHDVDDLAIVEGVIALAKSFKREVIAEGVETIEHGTALLQIGCDLAQGYAIAKPMPADNIPAWVSGWKPHDGWLP
jgi:diguanylate cyclase (GGDEF)-like protein/PAS domain S-box-containing protein